MKRLSLLLAIFGLSGGAYAASHAVPPEASLSKAALSVTAAAAPRFDWRNLCSAHHFHGALDWRPAKNQRIKRKNQRRALASGSKNAFA